MTAVRSACYDRDMSLQPGIVQDAASRLAELRAREDAAIRDWAAACAAYDHAIRLRACAINRAAAVVTRRMAPLTAQHYARIERQRDAGRFASLARTDGKWLTHLARTGHAVNEARARLAAVTAEHDLTVRAAKLTRAEATTTLLTTSPAIGRLLGLSAQQLAALSRRS
jgi:hypothetical protein